MTTPDWQRLAQTLRARMKELRLSYRSIEASGGPSGATLGKLLKGNPKREDIAEVTKERLEAIFQWETNSVDDVLAGGDPRPIPAPHRVDEEPIEEGGTLLWKIMAEADRLTEEEQRGLLTLLRANRK